MKDSGNNQCAISNQWHQWSITTLLQSLSVTIVPCTDSKLCTVGAWIMWFELHESTYKWFFFSVNTVYKHDQRSVESAHVEMWFWGTNFEVIHGFSTAEGVGPQLQIVLKSTIPTLFPCIPINPCDIYMHKNRNKESANIDENENSRSGRFWIESKWSYRRYADVGNVDTATGLEIIHMNRKKLSEGQTYEHQWGK